MNKEVYFDDEMTKGLLAGVKAAAKTVATTLGPAGRCVILEKEGSAPVSTKDGITVLKELNAEDHLVNTGIQLIVNASDSANAESGDGSTTTGVLAAAIIEEGFKATGKGSNPIRVKKGIDLAVKDVVEEIKKISKTVETRDEIKNIASISANNDEEIGEIIAEAVDKVGNDGVITIGESKTTETKTEFVEGMSFPNGYLSPYFSTDHDALVTEYENPYILITNKTLSVVNDMIPILEKVRQAGKQLLIIAPNVEGELLTTLIVNSLRGVIQACAVKAPGFGDSQKAKLEDIAILCGCNVIDEQLGYKFDSLELSDLGTAKNIKVTKDDTTIVDGAGSQSDIEGRVAHLKEELAEATSDYDKEKLQERIAKLAGGVAQVLVGAKTEAEAKEKRYRIEDSVNSVRASLSEGIIPGGGATLCHLAAKLDPSKVDGDVKIGYEIVKNALTKPIKQIAENAGVSGEVVADKVINSEAEVGYNALTDTYEDMFTAGIIDPAKVTRVALETAASVAGLVLTSGATITIKPEKKPDITIAQPMPIM